MIEIKGQADAKIWGYLRASKPLFEGGQLFLDSLLFVNGRSDAFPLL